MSAVDVLAYLQALEREIPASSNFSSRRAEAREARAAVSELMRREAVQAEVIADLRSQCVQNLELGAYGVACWEEALETIDAAIANIGAAP